jgi:hypothetical protein
MLVPPAPSGQPLTADWLAVGLLYYAALTGRELYSQPEGPFWSATSVLDTNTRELEAKLALLDAAIPRPTELDPNLTAAEDELALALVDFRVQSRADLIELCARAAAALDSPR